MDINDLRAIVTVLATLVFVGIVVYAYGTRRKKRFEDIGRSVLDDDDKLTANKEKSHG